jgi:subtilase-type serine protease
VHATVASALLNDAGFLADAVRSRNSASGDTNIWANENARWSNFNGNTNAASANGNLWGFGAGVDTAVDDGVRVGAAIGHSQDTINVAARSSHANVSTTYAGGYAALTSGALSFTMVLSYGWHKIGTLREISFGSFNSSATADYAGNTTNVFGELRYREELDGYFAEPFANISAAKLRTAAFSESAGTAALNGASASRDIIFTTLGSQFGTTYDLPGGGTLSPLVSLGWDHGSNNVTPTENLSFASGGSVFTVVGTPLARNSFATEAGFKLGLSDMFNVNLFYEGRVSGTVTENSVNAGLNIGF